MTEAHTIEATRTVRELAVEIPGATRLFETVGIDYCCGGGKRLDEACAAKGLDPAAVLASLEALGDDVSSGEDPATRSLTDLADYIVATHHEFTRAEIERLARLFEKVCAAHGENRPELLTMREVFAALAGELVPHMLKEERVLFPYVKELERAALTGVAPARPFFIRARNPVRMMELEHETAGELLAELRTLGRDYAAPEGACMTYRALLEGLTDLEGDLHRHIHLENNVLFPRAVALEPES